MVETLLSSHTSQPVDLGSTSVAPPPSRPLPMQAPVSLAGGGSRTMILQSVRPNIVQAIRAFRVEDLQQAASDAGQHFLFASMGEAQSKQDVLDAIAAGFLFPAHFGKNLDALYDCMTDLVYKSGPQKGFVVVLDQLPDTPRFDREAREQLLDVFRDAADYWGDRNIPFRCFYSFR